MYYVFRLGEPWWNYNYCYRELSQAKECANKLRDYLGHQYSVAHVETVWTTQTLEEALKEK